MELPASIDFSKVRPSPYNKIAHGNLVGPSFGQADRIPASKLPVDQNQTAKP